MSAALALPALLPGALHEQGMAIPADLTYEQWETALHNAEWLEAASPWFVVDLVAYGERHFGEEASQAWPTFDEDPTGARQAKLKQASWMASAWPSGTRVLGQSYTAHRVVAKLGRTDAVGLLNERDEDGKRLSTRELVRRADEMETAIRAEAMVGATAPVCAADAPWTPTADDLTDEARRALDFKASEIGRRHGIGFAVGWIAALRWSEQRDCFAEWRD